LITLHQMKNPVDLSTYWALRTRQAYIAIFLSSNI